MLIESSILPQFTDLPPDLARQVAELRTKISGQLVHSSQHIGRWTMREIHADWPGYQRASADIRRMMLQRIEQEETLLYPLIAALPSQQAA